MTKKEAIRFIRNDFEYMCIIPEDKTEKKKMLTEYKRLLKANVSRVMACRNFDDFQYI